MKLTLHSFAWHTVVVVFSPLLATRSATVGGMTLDNVTAAHSLDSNEADRGVNVSPSLRCLPTFTGYVTGFDLVDVTNKPNKVWRNNFEIVYGENRTYSIEANVAGEGIGSVVMLLVRYFDNTRTPSGYNGMKQNTTPYTLCRHNYSDLDLKKCGISKHGDYEISAKACSAGKGKGTCSDTTSFDFKISPVNTKQGSI